MEWSKDTMMSPITVDFDALSAASSKSDRAVSPGEVLTPPVSITFIHTFKRPEIRYLFNLGRV